MFAHSFWHVKFQPFRRSCAFVGITKLGVGANAARHNDYACGDTRADSACSETHIRNTRAIFRRFQGNLRSPSFYFEYAFANYREPVRQHSLTDAVAEYLANKTREKTQPIISAPQAVTIRRHSEGPNAAPINDFDHEMKFSLHTAGGRR